MFKELRTDPSKITGDLNRDMKSAMRATQNAGSNSIYMGSSVHMHSEHNLQNDARSQNAVSRIADDFLEGLASEMGVRHQPLSYGVFSQNGSFH